MFAVITRAQRASTKAGRPVWSVVAVYALVIRTHVVGLVGVSGFVANSELEINEAGVGNIKRLMLCNVSKQYDPVGPLVLDGVNANFDVSRLYCVLGASGSGKTTFLECASGLAQPSSGSVRLAGIDLTLLPDRKLAKLRRSEVGFVFQQHSLIESLPVIENVLLPARLSGAPMREITARAQDLLGSVGLGDLSSRLPGELSGGQKQRVGIARALVMRPSVVFADEPTSALDDHSAAEVMALLRDLCVVHQATVIVVTHDPRAARAADDVLELVDGELTARAQL
ncbi:ABC transporter ATP-binding protein [Rhodococcus sp. TAF43]|uniref:ABC transporter ATP-binding protein n=1 Tax=Rhodococcus sp. W8901 TaxID=2742603 RepID=UPI0015834B43|nr:ABC transporter ATP-binding protein [Rhodococcus sp. W8901]QKT11663.1 ABC transporter ATP-binding protein [Rhodococcus sp. W8901]